MRFARLLPVPEQATALSGLPMDVRNARPIVGDPELTAALDTAINDLRQALPLASTLGLRHAPRIIESYIICSDGTRSADFLMRSCVPRSPSVCIKMMRQALRLLSLPSARKPRHRLERT